MATSAASSTGPPALANSAWSKARNRLGLQQMHIPTTTGTTGSGAPAAAFPSSSSTTSSSNPAATRHPLTSSKNRNLTTTGAHIDKAGGSSWDDFLYERTLVCLNQEICSIAISPCHEFFVVGNGSGDVKVYDFESYAETHTVKTNNSSFFPPKQLTFTTKPGTGANKTPVSEFLIVLSGDGIRVFSVKEDFGFVKWIVPPLTKMLDSDLAQQKQEEDKLQMVNLLKQNRPQTGGFEATSRRHVLNAQNGRPSSKEANADVDLSERSRWQCVAFHRGSAAATNAPGTSGTRGTNVAAAPHNTDCIVACADMALVVYSTKDWGGAKCTPKILRSVMSWGAPTACAYSPSGNRVLVGHASGSISIWHAQTFAMEKMLSGHHGAITAFEFYTDLILEELEVSDPEEDHQHSSGFASRSNTESEAESNPNSRSPSKQGRRSRLASRAGAVDLGDGASSAGALVKSNGLASTRGGGNQPIDKISASRNGTRGGSLMQNGSNGTHPRWHRRPRVVLVSTSKDNSLRLWADFTQEDPSGWQLLSKIALEPGVHSPKLSRDCLWCLCVSPRLLIWKVTTLRQAVFRHNHNSGTTTSSQQHSAGSAIANAVTAVLGPAYASNNSSPLKTRANRGLQPHAASAGSLDHQNLNPQAAATKHWQQTWEHNVIFEPFQRLKATGMDAVNVAAFSPDENGCRVIVGSNDGVLGVFVRKRQLLLEYARDYECESYQIKRQLQEVVRCLIQESESAQKTDFDFESKKILSGESSLYTDTAPKFASSVVTPSAAGAGADVEQGGRKGGAGNRNTTTNSNGAVVSKASSPSKTGQDAEQQAREFLSNQPRWKDTHNAILTASSCLQLIDDIYTELQKKDEERKREQLELEKKRKKKQEAEANNTPFGERLRNANDLANALSGSPRTLFKNVVVTQKCRAAMESQTANAGQHQGAATAGNVPAGAAEFASSGEHDPHGGMGATSAPTYSSRPGSKTGKIPDFILDHEFAKQCKFGMEKMKEVGLPFLRQLIKEAGWTDLDAASGGRGSGANSDTQPQYMWHPGGSKLVESNQYDHKTSSFSGSSSRPTATPSGAVNQFQQSYRVLPPSSSDPWFGIPDTIKKEVEGRDLFRDFFVKALLLYERGLLQKEDNEEEQDTYYYGRQFPNRMRLISDTCSGVLDSGVPLVATVAVVSSPHKKHAAMGGDPEVGGTNAPEGESDPARAVDPLQKLVERMTSSRKKSNYGVSSVSSTPTAFQQQQTTTGTPAAPRGGPAHPHPFLRTNSGTPFSGTMGGTRGATRSVVGATSTPFVTPLSAASSAEKMFHASPGRSVAKKHHDEQGGVEDALDSEVRFHSPQKSNRNKFGPTHDTTSSQGNSFASAAANTADFEQDPVSRNMFETPQRQIIGHSSRPGSGYWSDHMTHSGSKSGTSSTAIMGGTGTGTATTTPAASTNRHVATSSVARATGAAVVLGGSAARSSSHFATPTTNPGGGSNFNSGSMTSNTTAHDFSSSSAGGAATQDTADSRPVSVLRALELRQQISRSASKASAGGTSSGAYDGGGTTATSSGTVSLSDYSDVEGSINGVGGMATHAHLRKGSTMSNTTVGGATSGSSSSVLSRTSSGGIAMLQRSRSVSSFSNASSGFVPPTAGGTMNAGANTRTIGHVTASASRTKLIAVSDHGGSF
ncbi:unnamed protein product [Amoebophrya sp. A120]|nr:unnamed protein product [Amoebophrya sp. A120]|eukprot:GSA120T00016779001.1